MKLKGITNKGFSRLARAVKGQTTEPDYGDSPDPKAVEEMFGYAEAEWTDEGWVVSDILNLSGLHISQLPFIKSIDGDFYCSGNQLTSLEGCPQEIGGSFNCGHNQLTVLEGSPEYVGDDFVCRSNRLTSLEGCPREVGGGFYCDNNRLTSLEGCPREVGGYFDCSNNQLISLEGAPQSVAASFYCRGNPGNFTEEDVRAVCDVGGDVYTDQE
jgi:hypothetical protein